MGQPFESALAPKFATLKRAVMSPESCLEVHGHLLDVSQRTALFWKVPSVLRTARSKSSFHTKNPKKGGRGLEAAHLLTHQVLLTKLMPTV